MIAQAPGSVHDFKVFKKNYRGIDPQIETLGDSGFQGIAHLHANSKTPHKSSKKHPLTDEQKRENQELARRRIIIEHINRRIKRFRILSARYRNRRKRHRLRVMLICGWHNYELELGSQSDTTAFWWFRNRSIVVFLCCQRASSRFSALDFLRNVKF